MTGTRPGQEPTPDTVTEADRIAAAVLAVPGVARLHGGAFGEIATYLPGRRVSGVRIDPLDPRATPAAAEGPQGPGLVEVHVVACYPVRVADLADAIRSALAGLAVGRAIDVHVEDYVVVEQHLAAEGTAVVTVVTEDSAPVVLDEGSGPHGP